MIILSGLGINLKSSLTKLIPDSYNFIESDSSIVSNMMKSMDMHQPSIDRCALRYMTIMTSGNNSIIDRGITDHMVIAKLMEYGLVDRFLNYYWIDIMKNWDSYVNLDRSINADRYLILTLDPEMISNELIKPEFIKSNRSSLYNSVTEYLELQDQFEYWYDLIVPNYKIIRLTDKYKSYQDKLEYLLKNLNL